ncbi:MAG: sensor domain-containing diguanylate cyclase [Pseudomonadota bacterium]
MIKITPSQAKADLLIKEPAYIGLTLLAFITTLLLLGYHLWLTHAQALEAAEINGGNLAWVLEERLDTTFRRVDADLTQIAIKALPEETKQNDFHTCSTYLAGFKKNFPEVNGYYIFDAVGQMVSSSEPQDHPINISDRKHFQTLRNTPNAGLIFSDVLTSRTNGRPMMVVARSIRNHHGKFLGIASATIDLDHFQEVFNSIEIGSIGAIALMRTDNQRLVLRHPSSPSDYNKEFISKQTQRILKGEKSGVERYVSRVDNILRIGSFRTLTEYPFFVNVAFAETNALAHWRSMAIRSIIGTSIFIAALIFLQIRLWRIESLRRSVIQKLDRAAQIDELTNLPNRRNFMMRAQDELSRTLRNNGCLSVLMVDIDNFKTINDTYGHKSGDAVLRKFGELCHESLRAYDIVGRIGGEEFAFLLPNTEITLGIEIAERIRENIENAVIETADGQIIHVTISIGVSALTNDNTSIDILLNQSDKAMYEAKHAGRNRVCVYKQQNIANLINA